ncbi:hypothetical protein [Streptomyces sp. NRRL S-1824]
MDNDPDIVCTVHADRVDDQDDEPDSLADLEAQARPGPGSDPRMS